MADPSQRGNPFTTAQIRDILSVLSPAALFALVAVATWSLTSNSHPDLGLYYRAADLFAQGYLPYRDFQFEYPPFALAACLAPILFGWSDRSPELFRWGFLFADVVYLTVITWAIREALRQENRSTPLWPLTLGAAILAPFLAWRYDLFPTMLTALALLEACKNRPILTGGLLGLAISAKLYPLVLLPVFGLWFFRRFGLTAALYVGFAAMGSLALTILPFLPDGISGLVRVLTFHNQRGVHVEGLSGGVVMLTNIVMGEKTPVGISYGAWHIHSPVTDALAPLHGVFFLCLYSVFLLLVSQRIFQKREPFPGPTELAIFSFGSILVFIVTNKVLSPQYIAWLFPFLPFLRPKQSVLFLAACAASIIIFPISLDSLLRSEPWAVVLLNFRNWTFALMLLSVLSVLSRETHSAYATPNSTSAYD